MAHILNAETLAGLQEFMPAPELSDFLGRVTDELEQSWQRLEGLAGAGDWPAVQKEAHRIKGVVGSVGCDALYQAFHGLESQLRAQPDQAPAALASPELPGAVGQAAQALRQAAAAL